MSNSSALKLVIAGVLGCAAVAGAQIVLHTVSVGEGPNAVAVDTITHKAFVSCEGVDSVYVLDATAESPEEFVIGRIAVGDYPVDVIFNPVDTTIWVVNKSVNSPTGSLTVIDANNNSAIATVEIGTAPLKGLWASAGNKLYTLETQTVSAVDCENNIMVGQVGVPDGAFNFTDMGYNPSMDRLYLTSRRQQGSESFLYVVDCTIDQIIYTVPLDYYGAMKLGYASSVNRLFVAGSGGTMLVVDCASNEVIGYVPIRYNPTSVMWSTTPVNRVWVACGLNGNAVHYMRADLLEAEGQINTPGRGPAALLYNPHTKKVFATSNSTHEIMVFNARIPGIIDTLRLSPFSFNPYDMALYPRMNRIFVANYTVGPGTVTVVLDFIGIEESPDRQSPLPARAMPNPVMAGRYIMLQAPGFKPSQATLVDASGRKVYQGKLGRDGALAAPEELGVYFYTVTDGRQTSSGKFAVR